jgi:hypothetical protein
VAGVLTWREVSGCDPKPFEVGPFVLLNSAGHAKLVRHAHYFLALKGQSDQSPLFCRRSGCRPFEHLALVPFRSRIQFGRNNKCTKKIMIWTRIYSRSKINLPIMISSTRDRRAGFVPHLLTSGLIPSLLAYLS